MEIKKVPISEVKVWDKNPRNIKTKDFERLKRQIEELGVYKPLICFQENGKYITLGGNMRLRVLNALLKSEVDISIVHPKSEAEKIKYALSDNDRAGEYEEQKLAELVYPHIEEINLEDYKLDVGEPVSLKSVIEDYGPDIDGEDEVPEIDDSPAVTKTGDLFQLGKHRLLCGDATKEEDVKRLMGGERADIGFYSPPYNLGKNATLHGNTKLKQSKYHGNQDDNPKYLVLLTMSTKNALEIGDYIFVNIQLLANNKNQFIAWLNEYREKLVDIIIWDKEQQVPAMARNVLNSQYEFIIILRNEKNPSRAINKKDFRGTISNVYSGPPQRQNENSDIIAATFPLHLPKFIIKNFSNQQNIVFDIFLGSGTTLIACEKLNRICYGMEIEPKYCDVIITRYANFTDIPEEEIRATVENG